jgi:hypothetical protein
MKGLLLVVAASAWFGLPELVDPFPFSRSVGRTMAFDWPESLGAVRFVLAPCGRDGWIEVARGESIPFRRPFVFARLFAVPVAELAKLPTMAAAELSAPAEQPGAAWLASGWSSATLPPLPDRAVPLVSPVDRVQMDMVVDRIEGPELQLRVVNTRDLDRDGNAVVASGVLLPALTAVAGIVLLVVFAPRRREQRA